MRRIYLRDSTVFHLSAARRHRRLARKLKGAEKFGDSIAPKQENLQGKHQASILANEQREDAYDDIQYADRELDDTIRTTYENCKQYDRDHAGSPVLLKLFPHGTFSDIINMPYAKEPIETERIATSIDALGSTHPLYPMAAKLRTKIDGVNKAITDYKVAVTALTHADVDEENAKAELRQQYEFNYLDARKELGIDFAERIFPILTSRAKDEESDHPDQKTSAA